MKPLQQSLLIAIGLSGVTTFIGWLAITQGYEGVGRVVLWPATTLQSLIPHPNIGAPEQPIYEGTLLDIVAFYFGLLLQVPIYWLSVNLGISWKRKQ